MSQNTDTQEAQKGGAFKRTAKGAAKGAYRAVRDSKRAQRRRQRLGQGLGVERPGRFSATGIFAMIMGAIMFAVPLVLVVLMLLTVVGGTLAGVALMALVFVPAWVAIYLVVGHRVAKRRHGIGFGDYCRNRIKVIRTSSKGAYLAAGVMSVATVVYGVVGGGDLIMIIPTAAAWWALVPWVAYDLLPDGAMAPFDTAAAKLGEASKALVSPKKKDVEQR